MSVKHPLVYKDMYVSDLSLQEVNNIESVRTVNKIDGLKNMIFDFPFELVERSIREGTSIRDIVSSEGIDYKQYIGELRDYQTVGTGFLYYSRHSILGDGVGLGKTAEISALINLLYQRKELKRFIMAVENSAIAQTAVELMRFTGLKVVWLQTDSAKLKRAIEKTDWGKVTGIIIKHSALRSDVFQRWLAEYAREDGTSGLYDTFILDESSVIKNNKSKTYTYAKNIASMAKRVHFMNATPFDKYIMDIYHQLDLMDDNLLPLAWRIEKEFCKHSKSHYWVKEKDEYGVHKPVMKKRFDIAGYQNQEIFKNRLKLVYFGRASSMVGLSRPNIYKVYTVEPNKIQLNAMENGYRYNEVLNCPSLVPDIKLGTNRKDTPKIDRLCDLVLNEFSEDKVMVYCFNIEAQEAIKRELDSLGRKCVILNGRMTGANKDLDRLKIQEDFNNGTYDVIITNIKKSLNLQGGDVCIFYSMSTTVSSMEQIRGRIDRNTNNNIKTFILLLYENTPEYEFFTQTVKQRAKDSRELTIDAKTAIDFFIDSLDA